MNSPERDAALELARQTLETLAKYFMDDTDTGDEWKNRCGKDFQEKIPIARQLLALHEEAALHRKALEDIAAFGDEGANLRLANTGSYGAFDEPGSVQTAREALAALAVRGEK